ncbi:Hsp20/alpha crystallin family protein [Caenimonas koreensis]|uniref:Hsp20 family protein n=1 Tax=Caenimonas koreensis DSM 17982 TaxID=1121255 RepID=A0A844B8T0_9BURK|nr:Hsp20/alpha crystallin family protein [Caenimonas koreensis]MRD47856.1 Hsp20 family protein [Caenimonas koreensis DSM 17982]
MSLYFAPVARTAVPTSRPLDRTFERFLNEPFFRTGPANFSFQETDTAWNVSFDLPGVAREDLTINIEGAIVRIETKAEAKRAFKGAYELPLEIDADSSEAKLENGVLELTLVKKLPVSNARTLAIK